MPSSKNADVRSSGKDVPDTSARKMPKRQQNKTYRSREYLTEQEA